MDASTSHTKLQKTADLRRVYTSYRAVFNGPNAKIRRVKPITSLIEKFASPMRNLLKDLGKDNVVAMIKTLLELGVFESEQKANIKFPELFNDSTARNMNRAASEFSIKCSTDEAVRRIESEGDYFNFNQPGPLPSVAVRPATETASQQDIQNHLEPMVCFPCFPGSTKPPTLYTISLPYSAQHMIVTHAQRILEECFWDWAKSRMPTFINRSSWDCPAAIELTTWLKQIPHWVKVLSPDAFQRDIVEAHEARLQQVLADATRLRHTAVHRLPTTARGLDTMLVSSAKLANLLWDPLRAGLLENLHLELERHIRSMELSKNALDNQLGEGLGEILGQRAELELKERQLYMRIAQEDESNMSLTGQLLQESVQKIISGEIDTESNEPGSDITMSGKSDTEDTTVGSEDAGKGGDVQTVGHDSHREGCSTATNSLSYEKVDSGQGL
ncbi:hypothetical protein MPDQ_001554 [Monascus purpureus]|uniref:Uncharacterized protein n=1 Tax=Monascus purpureus TaxID=5098 RepID=A0A507QMD5_MONPU|nr:hypothetical protein MPDQ_001554 [Monascus purpureus]